MVVPTLIDGMFGDGGTSVFKNVLLAVVILLVFHSACTDHASRYINFT